jgi:hypothetical protein
MPRVNACIHHLLRGLLTGLTAYAVAFSAAPALEVCDER